MLDLSQAISLEPVRERIRLFEPIKWCPPILQQRSGRGKLIEGMDWTMLIFGIVFAALEISLLLMYYDLFPFIEEEVSLVEVVIANIYGFPLWSAFIWYGWSEIKKEKNWRKINSKNQNLLGFGIIFGVLMEFEMTV
jgi:hypothetical protein